MKNEFNDDVRRFFNLFTESTFEGRQAAAKEMRKIVQPQNTQNQKFLLFHSFCILVRSDWEMLSWPNSPASAAKFLLNWSTTHVNVTSRSGEFFLDIVRSIITIFSDALPDYPAAKNEVKLLLQ